MNTIHTTDAPTTAVATPTTIAASAWPTSHLDAAEHAFQALSGVDETSLWLDHTTFGTADGLPVGRIALADLRTWMLAHRDAFDTLEAIWSHVITCAQAADPVAWRIAAAGLAMPALLAIARDLAPGYRGSRDDLDNDILTGFLAELARIDPARPGAFPALRQAAWRAAHETAFLDDETDSFPEPDLTSVPCSRSPQEPDRHVDLLIARAVILKLLTRQDAAAWIEVRLRHRPAPMIAARLGLTEDALRRRLDRADDILEQALTAGFLNGPILRSMRARFEAAAAHRERIRAARATPAVTITTRMINAMPPMPATV